MTFLTLVALTLFFGDSILYSIEKDTSFFRQGASGSQFGFRKNSCNFIYYILCMFVIVDDLSSSVSITVFDLISAHFPISAQYDNV